jgi:tetratricopeptide (TPR) repeat protein
MPASSLNKQKVRAVTFYSYKGGVGRSMALANMVKEMARWGKSVFVIDFDLEAPGMTYKLERELKGQEINKKGIVEYIYEFLNNENKLPGNLQDYYYSFDIKAGKDNITSWLMPAGHFFSANYWKYLSALNWKELMADPYRVIYALLHDLKARIEKEVKPDYIFIDSRTGVTDIATFTLRVMADRVLCFAVNNDENVNGTAMMVEALKQDVEDKEKDFKLAFVLSRLPGDNPDREKELMSKIRRKFDVVKTKNLVSQWLTLHIHRELEWEEETVVDKREMADAQLVKDYTTLFQCITDGLFDDNNLSSLLSFLKLILQSVDVNNPDKKIDLYRDAISQNPNHTSLLLLLGLELFSLSKNKDGLEKKQLLEESINSFTHFIRTEELADEFIYNSRGLSYRSLAVLSNGKQKYNLLCRSAEDYKKAISLSADYEDAYNNLGLSLYELALILPYAERKPLLLESIKNYDKAIKIDSNLHIAYYNKANSLYELGLASITQKEKKFREAVLYFKKAIHIKRTDYEYYYKCGLCLYELGTYKVKTKSAILLNEAVTILKQASDLHGDDFDLFNVLGNCIGELGMLKPAKQRENLLNDAIRYYELSVNLNKKSYTVYNNWSYTIKELALLKKGAFRQAGLREAIEKAKIAERLKKGTGIYNIACYYSLVGSLEKALYYLNHDAVLNYHEKRRKDILSDSDLKPIFNLSAFQQILNKYPV